MATTRFLAGFFANFSTRCAWSMVAALLTITVLMPMGCGEETANPPKAGATGSLSQNGSLSDLKLQDISMSDQPAHSAAGRAPQFEMPTIPAGAEYTIYCQTITAPNHVAIAQKMQHDLADHPEMKSRKMKDWWVVHSDEGSTLYYGFYSDRSKAREDQKAIQSLVVRQSQERLFPYSPIVGLPKADPAAPAEWNLENAPPKGYWSIQIAVFTQSDRKQKAVEAVRAGRTEGIDTYYYHGPNFSSVCVGAWPETAVVRLDPVDVRPDAHEPDREIFMMPPGMDIRDIAREQGITLGDDLKFRLPNGKEVEVRQQRLEIVDGDLKAKLRNPPEGGGFPEHMIDGAVMERKFTTPGGQLIHWRDRSFLVQIPGRGIKPNTEDPHGQAIFPDGAQHEAPRGGALPPADQLPPRGGKLPSLDSQPPRGGRLPSLDGGR